MVEQKNPDISGWEFVALVGHAKNLRKLRRILNPGSRQTFGRTFQKEYRELLRKHGVDFDERYAWD